MSQEVVVVDDVDAANDDSSSSDEQIFAGSDPDSDDEDEGAAPELEGNGAAEKGDVGDVRTHDQEFPMISDVAARYLCSSASSASSERLFSKAGLTMTKERMRLTGDSIARIISVRGDIVSGLLDSYYELP